MLRQTDIICRYSGEMFAALLVDTDEEEAAVFAERIRVDGQQPAGTGHLPTDSPVSVSLGIARFQNDFPLAQDWLQAADKALYPRSNRAVETNTASISRSTPPVRIDSARP